MSEIVCCVCMALAKALACGFRDDKLGVRPVTLYGGSSYCLEHLPHIDEAVGVIRRRKGELA